MRKVRVGLAVLAVVVLAVLAVALLPGRKTGDGGVPPDRPSASRTAGSQTGSTVRRTLSGGETSGRSPAGGQAATGSRPERVKPVLDLSEEDDENEDGTVRTPEEKALVKRIDSAYDSENLSEALACAPEALKCRVTEIRQAMVDTLGWFGKKALPELTPFLADSDEDVRESAMSEWSTAVADIDDEVEKIGTVELAMGVLTDEDALDDISSEYIGVDERLAVESLVRVIEGAGSAAGIAKAKETYEFVTGDEFESRAAAEKWIAEECDPPEPDQP